jgi:transposase
VVTSTTGGFYAKLDETLESFGFAGKVRELCAPAYDKSGVGRPGIDPAVYLKMLMVGFFEDLPSERAIAARCADSIAIRQFLHYELTEATPDHSSLSIIRQRLDGPIYEQVFTLVLSALQEHGLLRGRNVGIDSSVMEANASLRGLVNRNTGEAYWDYVKRLAAASGIDPQDSAAVRKFDRKRPKKMSNQEWENPDDPDAKIGPKKDGATDMIYKPQTVVDLDTGAIVGAELLPGDQADNQEVATSILEAQQNLNEARGQEPKEMTVETTTADKGYYAVGQLQELQREQIKTVICDWTNWSQTNNGRSKRPSAAPAASMVKSC